MPEAEKQGQFKITGRVEEVLAAETITAKQSGKSYTKRSIVVAFNEDDKYPRAVLVEFFGDDKVAKLADVGKNDKVIVHFNPSARKSGAKWFGALDGWKLEIVERSGYAPPPAPNGGGWGNAPDDEPLPF